MKSLVVLFGVVTAVLGSLNPNSRVQVVPAFQLGVRPLPSVGDHYRVEAENPDGSIVGQYGFQTPGHNLQVAYATAALNQEAGSSGVSGENETTTNTGAAVDATDNVTPQENSTELIPTASDQPPSSNAANPQNVIPLTFVPYYSNMYPQIFQARPFTSAYSPQYIGYAHSPSSVPSNMPFYQSGQQGFYNQPFLQTPMYGTHSFAGRPVTPYSLSQFLTRLRDPFLTTGNSVPLYSGSVATSGLQAYPGQQVGGQSGISAYPSTAQVYSLPTMVAGASRPYRGVSNVYPFRSYVGRRSQPNLPFAYSAHLPAEHRKALATRRNA